MSKIHKKTGSVCVICDESLHLLDVKNNSFIFHKTRRQTHSLCLDCGIGYLQPIINIALNNIRVNIRNNVDMIKCPGSYNGLTRNRCKCIKRLKDIIIPECSVSLDIFRINYILDRGKDTYLCPDEKCGAIVEVDYEYFDNRLNCYGGCNTSWCRQCLVSPYHDGKSCIEVEAENKKSENGKFIWDMKSKGMLKFCPQCKAPCIKNNGCFSRDTPILMWSGDIKKAGDIIIGDELIGDDGNKRIVQELVCGIGKLYKISQNKADDYIVNGNHTLVLKALNHKYIYMCSNKWKVKWFDSVNKIFRIKKFSVKSDAHIFCDSIIDSNIVHITVEEYLNLSKTVKRLLVGFRSKGVNWETKTVKIDPYLIGTWLGGGLPSKPVIKTQDIEVIKYWMDWVNQNDSELIHSGNCKFSIRRFGKDIPIKSIGHNTCMLCYGCNEKINGLKRSFVICDQKIVNEKKVISGLKTNPLLDLLKEYNLIDNKHIPKDYLITDRSMRLSLLAGIIDTAGCVSNNGKRVTIVLNNKIFVKQILLLSRSLGFFSTCRTEEMKHIKSIVSDKLIYCKVYYIINIIGSELSYIPTLIFRKKCVNSESIEDYYNTSISVTNIGEDKYYGWKLNGNSKFVLVDFTVTHNCNKMVCAKCNINWCWLCEKASISYDHYNTNLSGSCTGKLWAGVDVNGDDLHVN